MTVHTLRILPCIIIPLNGSRSYFMTIIKQSKIILILSQDYFDVQLLLNIKTLQSLKLAIIKDWNIIANFKDWRVGRVDFLK